MLITKLLKLITLLFFILTGSLASSSESKLSKWLKKSQSGTGFREVLKFFYLGTKEKSASSSESSMSDESSKDPRNYPEELAKFVNSLDWITKLFQHKDLLYSMLWPDHDYALVKLDACKTGNNVKKCTAKATDGLFNKIMKLSSLADKIKVLQAVDPLLNDKTAKYLVESSLDNLQDLLSTTEFLIVDEIKAIDKNSDNARALLSTEHDLADVSTIDSSIWFLLNQQTFCVDPFKEFQFDENKNEIIRGILKHQIILHADIDLELLFKNMDAGYKEYGNDMVSKWHRQLVKMSPFKDAQLYDTQSGWKLVGKSLLYCKVQSSLLMHLTQSFCSIMGATVVIYCFYMKTQQNGWQSSSPLISKNFIPVLSWA